MVMRIQKFLCQNTELANLSVVSDGACPDNDKKYIDLDGFFQKLQEDGFFNPGDISASCDSVLFFPKDNHLIFVEFKRFDEVQDSLIEWWKNKLSSINNKASETLLVLSTCLFQKKVVDYNFFFETKKSFFVVYRGDLPKKTMRRHSSLRIKRNNYLFENVRVMSCRTFLYKIENKYT